MVGLQHGPPTGAEGGRDGGPGHRGRGARPGRCRDGYRLLGTRSTLEDGVDLAARGLESIGAGDTPGAADRFTVAADTFQDGSDSLEGWLTWGGRFVPLVGQHVVGPAAGRGPAGVVLDRSAATTASTANYRELTADDGQVDLAAIAALQQPVTSSAATITAALASVETVRSPWLVRLRRRPARPLRRASRRRR